MTTLQILGPTDPDNPCDSRHPFADDHGINEVWHNHEMQRLINRWLQANNQVEVVSIQTRNGTELTSALFADVLYRDTRPTT